MSRGWIAVMVLVASAQADPPKAKVPPKCRGRSLDLEAIAQQCRVAGKRGFEWTAHQAPADMPPQVKVSIAPNPVRAVSGFLGSAAIVLENTGSAAADVIFSSCGVPHFMVDASLEKNGTPADVKTGCFDDTFCSGVSVHVVIEPQGSAHLPFTLDARYKRDACDHTRSTAIPPDTYELVLNSPFGELRGSATVTK